MASQEPPLSIIRTLLLGVVGIASLLGLWVSVFTTLPTLVMQIREYHSHLPDWISGPGAFLGDGDFGEYLFYGLACVILAAWAVSLFVFFPPAIRRFSSGALFFTVLGNSFLTIYLLAVSALGLRVVSIDIENKKSIYARELSAHSWLQAADQLFDKVQAMSAPKNTVEVKDASTLSKEDQRLRISSLIMAYKKTSDVAVRKRLIATSYLFRTQIAADHLWSEAILRDAVECGAPLADDVRAFYQWLEPKLGTDGWDPVPVYRVVDEN